MCASFIIFMSIPKAAEIIQGIITGRPFAFGTAIGEGFGPMKTVGTQVAGEAMNIRERAIIGAGGTTPWYVSTGRRLLNIRA